MTKQYRLAYTMREPCEDTGEMFLAEVPSLPGCCAWAETPEEALWILEGVAEAFIASHIKHGEPLPPEIAQVGELLVSA